MRRARTRPRRLDPDRSAMANRRKDWTERLARHRTGLAALSFAESTVLPIPLETIVAPLMVGHHRHSTTIALSIWLGCMAGATLFYLLGSWLFDPVVRPLLEALGLFEDFQDITSDLEGSGVFWSVFLVSFSPAPMQLATLGAGSVGGSFPVFLAAIATSRGIRYFGLAILAHLFGPRIADLDIPTGRLVVIALVVGLAIWGATRLF
jgi:membrane protein YqaA with SNARE-associated domain